MTSFISEQFLLIAQNFSALAQQADKVSEIAQLCTEAIKRGHKIMFCGNGGSAADSQHLAAELVGRYKLERPALNAIALTVDTSILTAVGNDYGYDQVFARQVEGIGRQGDVLIGLSTSGNSKNVILAMQQSHSMGITTVALTGASGSQMSQLAQYALAVPSSETNHIQEMHIAVGHLICELIEKALYAN